MQKTDRIPAGEATPLAEPGDVMYEYRAESQWAGFGGGYGAEHLLSNRLNELADQGWRLVLIERMAARWYWFMPRTKLLYIFQRSRWEETAEGAA